MSNKRAGEAVSRTQLEKLYTGEGDLDGSVKTALSFFGIGRVLHQQEFALKVMQSRFDRN